jgi:hypothetical protein
MPLILDYKYESLAYTARFQRPVFQLWGAGATIASAMYEAYLPFNVPLSNFQLGSAATSAADVVVTVKLGDVGTSRFAFDRTESSFANFSEEAFQTFPRLLAASTDWLRNTISTFKVASHHFVYSNHSLLKGGVVADFLKALNPRKFKSAGESIGNGAIFNHVRKDAPWQTQLVLDRSLSVNEGLFASFGVTVIDDKIDYVAFLADARKYFEAMLADLDLRLPGSSS